MKHYRSYAKANFYLKINDYSEQIKKHKLTSKLVLIDQYYDDIYLTKANTTQIKYENANQEILNFQDDILLRTKHFLESKLNQEFNFNAKVIKRIPTLAGLGSGSSNAAILIKWIYQEYKINNQISYYEIATELGSDIPFFLSGYDCAIIKNFGDQIIASDISGYKFASFVFNKQKPSTKEIFRLLDHTKINVNDINDLEKPFFKLFPELYESFIKLKKPNNHVLLSGAGSSFVIFEKLN
ncbi:4-diphosphocytidyl-2C-methyl-D-erythritol synthase [Mycoplasma sp. E35C]|uniref:GHMP family kinase ATP-binding protein n=1 Tax=Mycoplasma sp. E35C TaxID=2801918 RepID=UPI001CA44493|nr:4-diphosphocytidyl-2C-methyl-D-erythritol synthase [Mycoplasma sp. E35C]QZX49156.1 4-diphosphocytidyl-2C-methyl-D-erythritol synthase [Mycoplasma sp. E35C]